MNRTLAIGDIHGNLEALRSLAARIPFEADDLIVTLGDYVDRGPDSSGVLDWLIDLLPTGRLVPLMGNHDLMMVEAMQGLGLRSWLSVGGAETLASYGSGGQRGTRADVPEAHLRFIEEECRSYYETSTHVFVHAGVDPSLPLEKQPDSVLFWAKLTEPRPHRSGKTVVCGHTAQKSGWPLNAGHTICIDTWVYGSGWLTCLDVHSGEFWQARADGQMRIGHLESIPAR